MGDLLVVTGGHRVDLAAMADMVDDVAADLGWRWAHAVQPTAQGWLAADTPWDVILLHDIAGLQLARGIPPRALDPSEQVRSDVEALLDQGRGLVVLHHALASWPGWGRWSDAVGGAFLYAPGPLRGVAEPSSGYCLTKYTAYPVGGDHPVLEGITAEALEDEPYLCPMFEEEVVPLLRGDFETAGEGFISTYESVLAGEEAAPRCAGRSASDLIAWATSSGATPIVYIQPGDSAATFALPWYRRLLANAVRWVGSEEARRWAIERSTDRT